MNLLSLFTNFDANQVFLSAINTSADFLSSNLMSRSSFLRWINMMIGVRTCIYNTIVSLSTELSSSFYNE
jgi:hypothetical protein